MKRRQSSNQQIRENQKGNERQAEIDRQARSLPVINPSTVKNILTKQDAESQYAHILNKLAERLEREALELKRYAEWIISQADDNITVAAGIRELLEKK